jgi:hypothetical protein
MAGGVFAVARSIWEHEAFQPEPFTQREAWMWLVGSAAWKPLRIRGSAKRGLELQRGEFAFATRFLAEKWKWSKSRVDRFLSALENRDMLRDTSRDGVKVYFISNYDDFQVVGLPDRDAERTDDRDSSGTAAGQQRDKEETFKHLNIESPPMGAGAPPRESVPKTARKTAMPPLFPGEPERRWATNYWTEKGRPDLVSRVQDEIDQFRDHHAGKVRTMALDWPATWRTWARKALTMSRAPPGSRQIDKPEWKPINLETL